MGIFSRVMGVRNPLPPPLALPRKVVINVLNMNGLFVYQASEELEDRESLAQIAASGEDTSLSDGETYIGMLISDFLTLSTQIMFL